MATQPSTVDNHGENISANEVATSGQYFTFMLAGEEYGIDILSVVEIRGWEKATPLPSAPPFVRGVINLRGVIIPVIDLRQRFQMAPTEYGVSTVVIVLQVQVNQQQRIMGIIVDGVSDVYNVTYADIKPKPEICSTMGHEYISGLVSIKQENKNDKLVILLDANKLLDLRDAEHTFSALSEK